MQETPTLGQDLDARGLTVTLEEGDLISDVVLISEIIQEDGDKRIVISAPDFSNWLKVLGMLTKAQAIILAGDV